jgi:RNAse (barnase) inhibitor barstar
LRSFRVNSGLPSLPDLRAELEEYIDVLMGRVQPPIENEEMTLMEYANAVYSRAMEVTMLIQRAESEGTVLKGSKYYRFRTGELRTFTELAARCIELGSRRVTKAQLDYSMVHG